MRFIRSAFRNTIANIMRNKLVSFLCLGIIAFTLLVYGIFDFITLRLDNYTQSFSKDIKAIFYIKDDVFEDDVQKLIDKIKQNILVKNVFYVSKDRAKINFERQFPELVYILSEFKKPPFPASIEVEFKRSNNIETKIVSFIEEVEKLSIIESKQVNLQWAKKINSLNRFINVIGIFLSFILIFISIFIIFNVIKLNIFYRKEEINIMRLVGATNWYIKVPFIIEGGVLGFLGSLFSIILLFFVFKLFPFFASYIYTMVKELMSFNQIPSHIIFKLIFIGTVIGLFSSYISVKSHLK